MDRGFWIVWSPTGSTPPKRRHNTHDEAMRVCKEMAESHPGQTFYALLAQARAYRPPAQTRFETLDLNGHFVDRETGDQDDEIPF